MFGPEDYKMEFGMYEGSTLREIAQTSRGLLWLDWASDELKGFAGEQIRKYVQDPTVSRMIQDAVDDNDPFGFDGFDEDDYWYKD
jgi:hypothetical protein